MRKIIFAAIAVAFILGFNVYCQAGWILYDDFNSGSIDPKKWKVDNSSAQISIENGQAKFIHQEGFERDSSYLEMMQNPNKIKGIKVRIKVASCSGDVKARVTSFIGKTNEDNVFTSYEVRSDRQYISASLPLLGPPPDFEYRGDFFWGHFKSSIDIFNNSYILSMIVEPDNAFYKVEGQGVIEYSFPTKLSAPDNAFKAIGTRSENGDGPCTVYFDDVYVYFEKGSAPAIQLLLDD